MHKLFLCTLMAVLLLFGPSALANSRTQQLGTTNASHPSHAMDQGGGGLVGGINNRAKLTRWNSKGLAPNP